MQVEYPLRDCAVTLSNLVFGVLNLDPVYYKRTVVKIIAILSQYCKGYSLLPPRNIL